MVIKTITHLPDVLHLCSRFVFYDLDGPEVLFCMDRGISEEPEELLELRSPVGFLRYTGPRSQFNNNPVENLQLQGQLNAFTLSGTYQIRGNAVFNYSLTSAMLPYTGISNMGTDIAPITNVLGVSIQGLYAGINIQNQPWKGIVFTPAILRWCKRSSSTTDPTYTYTVLSTDVVNDVLVGACVTVSYHSRYDNNNVSASIWLTGMAKQSSNSTYSGRVSWNWSQNRWQTKSNAPYKKGVDRSTKDRDLCGYRIPNTINGAAEARSVAETLLSYVDNFLRSSPPNCLHDDSKNYLNAMVSVTNYSKEEISAAVERLADIYGDFGIVRTLKYASPTNLYVELYDAMASFSGNLIAYSADLKKTGDTIKSMLRLVGNYKNPKSWASAWLSYRYGDRLAVKDSVELVKSIRETFAQGLASKADGLFKARVRDYAISPRAPLNHPYITFASGYRAWEMWFHDHSANLIEQSVKKLIEWDAWPTLENIWDLVPLSFVVDWLIPVGKLLHEIDTTIYSQYVVTDEFLSSYRAEFDVDPIPAKMAGLDVSGLRVIYYRRDVSSTVPVDYDYYNREVDWGSGLTVTHCIDGLSLFVQLK